MKTRDEFVRERSACWTELENLLLASRTARDGEAIGRVATRYRELCADLMRARALGFGPDLQRRLDALAARAHNFLYRTPRHHTTLALRRVFAEFPRTVRREWPYVLTANLVFWLPFAIGLLATLFESGFAERVLPAETLESMSSAYSQGFAEGRASGEDAAMTGFYVGNNIGIAFRCFATGILFGSGSLFFLIYNGLTMGTVLGYVSAVGHARNILTFVSGHSAFELSAILLCGAAGLKLGYSLVDTGGLTRVDSLKLAGRPAITLVLGSTLFLSIAALIEGFWSPSSAPDPVKWAVAAANTALVLGFLSFGGARRGDATR